MQKRTFFLALAAIAALASPSSALLQAQSLDGWTGRANLVDSRLTIHVGPQWIDVEEEAEVLVVPSRSGSNMRWIVEGTFEVPKGTAITGCMLWNGDTLLMGKLRGKQQANAIFDSLVPPRNPAWARDPLLVEQLTETTYGMKLFPFEANGTRRFRLRYLVPRSSGSSEISVKPLMARSLNGTIPASFRLRLRGSESNMRIVQDEVMWPAVLPSSEKVSLSREDDVRLRWAGEGSSDAGNALRGSQASGGWAGDYVMYSGKLPDSILAKVNLKSETVVLWSWIQPRNFLTSCDDYYYGGTVDCLASQGYEVIEQAAQIRSVAQSLVESGNRVGMVADEGLDDSLKVFAMGDSSSSSWRSMNSWLEGLTIDYLKTRIPTSNSAGGIPTNLSVSRSRSRFQVDLRRVATLYSADSGIIRHLLVVTAGVSASSESLEEVDASILPKGVSVTSTNFGERPYSYNYSIGFYTFGDFPKATWPGIDLGGLEQTRPGTSSIEVRDGLRLPRNRTQLPVCLSIGTSSGRIGRNVVVHKDQGGRFVASLNVHGKSLGKTLTWAIYGDSGETLASWEHSPEWTDVAGDSVFPRLWAKSEIPMSPIFEDRDLGPIFGVVDFHHSLLATPSDTLGALRQAALRDSGVPFLSYAEIFPRQGFGQEGELGNGGDGDGNANTAVGSRLGSQGLKLSWLSARRTLRIQLAGLTAQGIEIRDLRGRLLASYTASQLAGLASLDWTAPAGLGRGMILVSVRTSTGLQTASVMMN